MPARGTSYEHIYVATLLDRGRTVTDQCFLKAWNQFFLGPPMDGNVYLYL